MAHYDGMPAYNAININSWMLRLRTTVNGCLNGKTNNVGTVTLTTSTSTTTVVLAEGRITLNSVILFMPLTASAANEVSTATMWVSTLDPLNNQFMITNAVNTQNDRNFSYIIVG